MTKFFEPINISATHIYHSALELSPLSSIVRRLYYHRRHTFFPRVMVGNPDSWDPWIAASWEYGCDLCTWSPCGRFIAAESGEGAKICDSLSFELLSTLMSTERTLIIGQLAYSMDGRSVASAFRGSLGIWDIQTGGVAKEIEYEGTYSASLAWSLNGSTICIISKDKITRVHTVYIYDVASGVMRSPGVLPSADGPYVWAHDTSFRVMTTAHDGWGCLINIFEVGSILTRIESFHIEIQGLPFSVESFSQTTYRISIFVDEDFFVFDARTSRRLSIRGLFVPQCFSPDGSLFAGISRAESAVRIWKYTSDDYTPWREFLLQHSTSTCRSLQFSPTSSSLLAHCGEFLQLWRLDGPPIVAHPNRRMLLVALSCCGSYVATSRETDTIVTITNLLSQSPPHFIDTGMMIKTLALTGNILLALGSRTIVAWRLTGEGAVDGVFSGGRAGHDDSIWTVSISGDLTFFFGDETVAISQGRGLIWGYHIETGEVPESTGLLNWDYRRHYTSQEMLHGRHHHCHHDRLFLVPLAAMHTGWAKDSEGKHQLWIPVEWRNSLVDATSSHDSKALRLNLEGDKTILIRF